MKKYNFFKNSLLAAQIILVQMFMGIIFSLLFNSIPNVKEKTLNIIPKGELNPVGLDFSAIPFLSGVIILSFYVTLVILVFINIEM